MAAVSTGLSARARAEIDASIAESALRIERWISVGRIAFFSALLVRFALVTRWSLANVLSELPLVLGIGFSVYVLARVKHPPRGQAFWFASVTLDTLAAHAALSHNAISPRAGYLGIMRLPDTAGILIATVSAGLRLSVWAAVWAGVLNIIGLLILVRIDQVVSGSRIQMAAHHLSIHTIFIATATVLSTVFAAGTRRIVARSADAALRAQQAERGLGSLLADCHDARSLLTSARISADVIHQMADAAGAGAASSVKAAGEHLLHDLDAVRQLILGVNERALADLCVTQTPSTTPVATNMARVERQIRIRFPEVSLVVDSIPQDLQVQVAGGDIALQRVLLNLLCNACEGDGEIRPQEVTVGLSVAPDARHIELCVGDDGPGLEQHVTGTSTKPQGLGVGLRVVRGIVESSGGRVAVRQRRGQGTIVCVQFPAMGR